LCGNKNDSQVDFSQLLDTNAEISPNFFLSDCEIVFVLFTVK